MYAPAIIAEKLALLRRRGLFPKDAPFDYTIADTRALTAQILKRHDPEHPEQTILTKDENDFAAYARLRILVDAPYYLEGFVYIDEEGHGLRALYPLWKSQQYVLDRLALLERKYEADGNSGGLLLNILKVRQVGVSTLGMALVSHRILTQSYIRAIAGSDTEEQARYLFRMAERIYDQLPYFLTPDRIVPYTAGRELNFSNKSSLKTAWGKTTRGALQDVGGKKGNIERGRTNSVVHVSELATWDNPEQLDSSLLPGIPTSPQVLVLFESTAELAGDWWHRHWLAAEEGEGRFRNLFIPWPVKYEAHPPTFWEPSEETLNVGRQIEQESPQWGVEPIVLTREHLYWYESTRAYYAKKNELHTFLKEYPSNPRECFAYAGRSIFTLEEMQRIDQAAKGIIDVWAVEPSREIAELKQMAESTGSLKADAKALADKRPIPPVVTVAPEKPGQMVLVPQGYGFRRLGKQELADLPSLRQSVLSIYEYPRKRGPRRYVGGVDVGDGLGLDYSVITIVRLPTIEEPAEEVAQYVTNKLRPSLLSYVADAIGRYYCDEDGLEALMAIELNNHGATVQDLLQLHLGYTNFYVWEVVDAASPESRFTKRIGWSTTSRTRPILLEKFHDAVTTVDPLTGCADFRLNSPITRGELRHFVTDGLLGEAEHARGQHDDGIFSSGFAYYVAHRLAGGESEPIAERRRRRAHILHLAADTGVTRDYRNSAVTAEEADDARDPDVAEFDDDDTASLYFSDRSRA